MMTVTLVTGIHTTALMFLNFSHTHTNLQIIRGDVTVIR